MSLARPTLGGSSLEHIVVDLHSAAAKCDRCGAAGGRLWSDGDTVDFGTLVHAMRQFAGEHTVCDRGGQDGIPKAFSGDD